MEEAAASSNERQPASGGTRGGPAKGWRTTPSLTDCLTASVCSRPVPHPHSPLSSSNLSRAPCHGSNTVLSGMKQLPALFKVCFFSQQYYFRISVSIGYDSMKKLWSLLYPFLSVPCFAPCSLNFRCSQQQTYDKHTPNAHTPSQHVALRQTRPHTTRFISTHPLTMSATLLVPQPRHSRPTREQTLGLYLRSRHLPAQAPTQLRGRTPRTRRPVPST